MISTDEYRDNAEECLRRASEPAEADDMPLWVTMAQSWLRLAEHADRLNRDLVAEADDDRRETTFSDPEV